MRPASYWSTFARMGVITGLLFGLATLVLYPAIMGLELRDALPLCIFSGLSFGVLFGFVMASLMKSTTISVPF